MTPTLKMTAKASPIAAVRTILLKEDPPERRKADVRRFLFPVFFLFLAVFFCGWKQAGERGRRRKWDQQNHAMRGYSVTFVVKRCTMSGAMAMMVWCYYSVVCVCTTAGVEASTHARGVTTFLLRIYSSVLPTACRCACCCASSAATTAGADNSQQPTAGWGANARTLGVCQSCNVFSAKCFFSSSSSSLLAVVAAAASLSGHGAMKGLMTAFFLL